MRRMSPARRGPLDLVLYAAVYAVLGAATVLLAAAGLTSCTGSDPGAAAPSSLHPGTAATPTTSTPSGNPTDLAGAAAIAAVQKLYAEYNRMLRSGSSAAYRKTFTTACTFCVQDALGIDRISSRGQTISGGTVIASGLRLALARTDLVVVEGDQTDSPAAVHKGGRVVTRFAGGAKTHLTWRVQLVADTWLVTDESPVK